MINEAFHWNEKDKWFGKSGPFSLPEPSEWFRKALVHMGYPSLDKVKPEIGEVTRNLAQKVPESSAPEFLFRSQTVEEQSRKGFSTRQLSITSPKWAKVLAMAKGSKQACCFAVTLGGQSETGIQEHSSSLMRSYVWDALCSTLAEHYADQAEAFISRRFAETGLASTRRFSPGYCDLDFENGQKELFAFLNPEKIGIRRNTSGLMIPRKSITGIVLGAENLSVEAPCGFCKARCPHCREG